MKYIFTISLLIVFAQDVFAQNVFRDLKKLEKRADKYYSEMSFITAIDLYRQALDKPKNSRNNKIRIKIAKSYLRIAQTEEAESYYKEAIQNGYRLSGADSIQYARTLISNNKYEEAKLWMNPSLDKETNPSDFAQFKSLQELQSLYRDSFSFSAKPIIYNSAYSDYSPVYYNNGIVFSSDRPSEKLIKNINMQKNAGFTELYFFREKDTIQRQAELINLDYKSSLHKGPAVFFDNGNKMIVTLNAQKGAVSRLQMFIGEWDKQNNIWKNFQPFPYNSDFYSVGHPAISKDERTLYFVSDLPGGNGGTDIYISHLKDGEWSKPKSMREPINTEGNEMFPYISPSGKFYFASDGHGGLGGLDIFYYSENSDENKQEIFNPGYPLNSSSDDFGIVLDNQERSGYFSSDRKGGKGEDDIYRLYIKKVELRLKVSDEIAGATVAGPEVKLIDKESGEEIKPLQATKDNNFKYNLKLHHSYKLVVQKEDYKTFEKDISTIDIEDDRQIDIKATMKRKFEYYITMKIRDLETENIVENATVLVLNQTTRQLDSIGINARGELDLKLDAESDYLLLAYKNKMVGQVAVEKQNKKKVSSVRFVTLNISEPEEKMVIVHIKDSIGNKMMVPVNLILKNMITGGEETVTSSDNGQLGITLKNGWYYRLYYSNKQYYYDSLRKLSTGNLLFEVK
jgi:hypothetical protein